MKQFILFRFLNGCAIFEATVVVGLVCLDFYSVLAFGTNFWFVLVGAPTQILASYG